jgi:uncharacterized protein
MHTMNRRELLFAAGAGLLGPAALQAATSLRPANKKILFFTKSSGFQHSVINRNGGDSSHAERILKEIGKAHGYDVTCSKDGKLFEPDQIGEWDGFAFYTTGILTESGTDGQPPMSPKGKDALLEAIHGGKGFAGMHCATDTFHAPPGKPVDDYTKMIGGEFAGHGPQHVAKLIVSDTTFPGVGPFGADFELNDEWYAQKNQPDDLHVIIYHITEGMQGDDYKRPNYPETWIRKHGEGKVFYTSMGHREDVWTNPKYQGLLIGGLNVVTGQADADFTPNVLKVTPDFKTIAKK